MKRILSVSPMILCLLFAFLPFGSVCAKILGYEFDLRGYPISAIALAVASAASFLLLSSQKISLSKVEAVFSALLLPMSAINGLFLVFKSDWRATVIFVLICCVCSAAMLLKFAHPFALKMVSAIASGFLIVILLLASFLDTIVQDANTVVKSIPSLQSAYTAHVIDNDQGALGGNTYVTVEYNKKIINLFICELSKPPVGVYRGDYGEFAYMQVSWKDEDTLIINGLDYDITD